MPTCAGFCARVRRWPWTVPSEQLTNLVVATVRRNELETAYVKWILTRGSNGTPLMDPVGCVPNLIIMARPYIDRSSATGLRLKTVAVRRPPGQVLDAHVKSFNYLNLVMASTAGGLVR